MRKRIICDASSLISLSMNCMLPLITELSEKADFIVTESVYDEIITNPLKGGHHMMGPLKFRALFDCGVLKKEAASWRETDDILDLSNRIYYSNKKALRIIQRGEAEALALANDGDVLLMDERTLRFMIEKPRDLMGLLEHRLHRKIRMDGNVRSEFDAFSKGVKIIRSSEIVAVAYELGILQRYFSGDPKTVLKACLWALKHKGCSLSVDDIDEYLRTLA